MGVESPYGRVVLVSGPEGLLADRAIEELVAAARAVDPEVEVTETDASRLDVGLLAELTGGSLFSSHRVAVVRDLAQLPADLLDPMTRLATEPVEDLALALVHGGGMKGKGLLDRLKKAKVRVVDCPAVKAWELPQFVTAEVRRAKGTVDSEAAQFLVEAIGHDLRSLVAGVTQLLADSDDQVITVALVRRYFGGRSEVTSFAVADATLTGRTGIALEQLRWALSTGVPPVLVTSALASGLRGLGKLVSAGSNLREVDLAREVGVPPWKLKSLRSQARGWDQGSLARAIKIVAEADADIKGAADDAGFALERAVLAVSLARVR
ncbi:MAG: DNA polymerase III subunit delta [Propionibacteriaceae bacterium]